MHGCSWRPKRCSSISTSTAGKVGVAVAAQAPARKNDHHWRHASTFITDASSERHAASTGFTIETVIRTLMQIYKKSWLQGAYSEGLTRVYRTFSFLISARFSPCCFVVAHFTVTRMDFGHFWRCYAVVREFSRRIVQKLFKLGACCTPFLFNARTFIVGGGTELLF